jgi:hypothetical protein
MASVHALGEYLVPEVSLITYDWDKHVVNLNKESDRQFFIKYKDKITNVVANRL